MQPPYAAPPPAPPPPAKKGMSTLTIVLLVIGGLLLAGVGTCAAGVFWLKGKAEGMMSELHDGGGIVLAAPAAVKAELAGPKKEYVGHWRADGGSTLDIDADGNLKIDKRRGGNTEKLNAPIAAFRGSDMEIKVLVTLTLAVSRPPHEEGDHWEMTVDGITYERR